MLLLLLIFILLYYSKSCKYFYPRTPTRTTSALLSFSAPKGDLPPMGRGHYFIFSEVFHNLQKLNLKQKLEKW